MKDSTEETNDGPYMIHRKDSMLSSWFRLHNLRHDSSNSFMLKASYSTALSNLFFKKQKIYFQLSIVNFIIIVNYPILIFLPKASSCWQGSLLYVEILWATMWKMLNTSKFYFPAYSWCWPQVCGLDCLWQHPALAHLCLQAPIFLHFLKIHRSTGFYNSMT